MNNRSKNKINTLETWLNFSLKRKLQSKECQEWKGQTFGALKCIYVANPSIFKVPDCVLDYI